MCFLEDPFKCSNIYVSQQMLRFYMVLHMKPKMDVVWHGAWNLQPVVQPPLCVLVGASVHQATSCSSLCAPRFPHQALAVIKTTCSPKVLLY